MTPQEIEALRSEALKDKVDALSDMVGILKAERDALAAQLNTLRTATLNAISFMSGGTAKAKLRDAYDATPQQCLRDVQAEAIQAGLDAIGAPVTKFAKMSGEFVAGFNFCAALLQQHSAKVRQGGAE